MASDKLKQLMETIREMEQSPENIKRRDRYDWQRTPRDQWRGTPKLDSSCLEGNVPLQVDCNNTFWAKYFGYSVEDYFLNPEVFLENVFKIAIERFKLFDDDVFIQKSVPIWFGSAFEASLVGMNVLFSEESDPWIDYKDVITCPEDLDKMVYPDFYKSGLMPQAINVYEYCRENLDDDFEVLFPEWQRGPFGMATYTRGFGNTLMDMMTDEDFAHRYMRYFIEAKMSWCDQRSKYLGIGREKTNLYNDEINIPSLSPALYEEFVLPYEQELCKYHGGIFYWHSCGKIDPFLPVLDKAGKIEMIHKGPWTDVKKVGEVFSQKAAIEICLNPQEDIIESTQEQLYNRLTGFCTTLNGQKAKGYTIRANNIGVIGSTENSIKKSRDFITVARKAASDAAIK